MRSKCLFSSFVVRYRFSSLYSTSSPTGYSPLGKRFESRTRGGSDCFVGRALAPPAFFGFLFLLRFFFAPPSAPPSPVAPFSSSSSSESSASGALPLPFACAAAAEALTASGSFTRRGCQCSSCWTGRDVPTLQVGKSISSWGRHGVLQSQALLCFPLNYSQYLKLSSCSVLSPSVFRKCWTVG